MAESSSDSDSSITGWTVVNQQGEYCASDSGSTSSSLEFVQLDDTGALYQRRSSERNRDDVTKPTCDAAGRDEDKLAEPEVTASTARPEELGPLETPLDADSNTDTDLSSSPTKNESEPQQEAMIFDPLNHDPLDDLDPDQASPLVNLTEKDGEVEPHPGPSTSDHGIVDQNQQIEILHAALLRQESDSDSDFVKLDALQTDSVHMAPAGHMVASGGEGRSLEAALHTPPTASSSISTQFRFVNPPIAPNLHQPNRPEDGGNENADDEEDESLIGDFDDRCESDISGVATDDTDDSDLLSMIYSIDDVPLTAGRRLYRHRPNSDLNAILTVVSLVALFFAVGIALGHYIGVSRDGWLRRMQVEKMKGAQDNHLMCLRQADLLKGRIRKLTAIYGHDSPCSEKLDGGSVLSKTCGEILQMSSGGRLGPNPSKNVGIQTAAPVQEEHVVPSSATNTNQETEAQLKEYVVALRTELNQVEQENADLRVEVMRLRYTAHPANAHVDPHLTQQQLKVKVNQLTSENDDLKSAVGKMRYTVHPGNMHQLADEPSDVDVEVWNTSDIVDIQTELATLERHLQNVSLELRAEKKMNAYLQGVVSSRDALDSDPHKSATPATPISMLSCVQQHLPDVSSTVGKYLEGSTHEYLAKFNDATKETTDQIVSKWNEIVQLLGAKNIKLTAQVERLLRASWENGDIENATGLDENNLGMDIENKSDAALVNVTGKPLAAHFQDYVNKTKMTVSKLSTTLQETWQKVKNLSNDFIINPETTVKKVSAKIHEKVSVIKEEVTAKWDRVKRNANPHVWSHPEKKEHTEHLHKQQYSHHPHSKTGKTGGTMRDQQQQQQSQQQQQPPYGGQQSSHGGQQRSESPQFEDMPKHFEDKPHHKQRQSSHDQYNDFWQKVEFDPDDFFQEGFFEGNQREWRKHQKRLKHLHGRMHRLNEDILYSMDDDDIEDIYDDFDDLEDDLEDEDQPQTLQTWLACQVRWWKSRLHRKHRSEDLIRGCGQQMMQWQLRALCKDRCVGKKCWKKGRVNLKEHPLCQQALHPQDNHCHRRGQKSSQCHNDMKKNQGFHSNPSHQKGYAHVKDGKGYDRVKDGNGYDRVKNSKGFDSVKDSPQKMHSRAKPIRPIKPQKPAELPSIRNTATILPVDKSKFQSPPPPQRRTQLKDEEELFTMEMAKDTKDWQINNTVWTPAESEGSAEGFHQTAEDNPASADDTSENDASWIFERAVLREYHHHNPDWVFERAEERDKERNKPWYVGRSEQRQYQRLDQREKQEYRQP